MSENINNGGAAFPLPRVTNNNGDVEHWEEYGMTMRDYFAAKFIDSAVKHIGINSQYSEKNVASMCYRYADAMIKARSL